MSAGDLRTGLGGGASLRPVERSDARELFLLTDRSRERLRHWLPWVDASRSVADTDAYLAGRLAAGAEGRSGEYVVVAEGRIGGVVGFHEIDWANEIVGIGYWLGDGYEGRGLMTRAVAALTDHALGPLGLNRVEIQAATDNVRSRAIPERLGFTREGVRREAERLPHGHVDLVVYSLLAMEWREVRRRWPVS